MSKVEPSTQLWLGAWELLQGRSHELFRILTRDCKDLELESIHDLRVSSRRLREGLALFAPCFPKRHLTSLRSQLKQLTGTLGSIRNTDEALHFFAQLVVELNAPYNMAAEELLLVLKSQRDEEQTALKKKLKTLRPTALRVLFDHTCNNPIIFNSKAADPLQPVADFLRNAIAKRETPLHELYPLACVAGNVAAQHRLRIAIKRFRYRMEYFSFLVHQDYAEIYAQTKNFQDLLGHLHDLDLFATLVSERVSDLAAQQAMQELIARKRQILFAEFLRQDASCPVISLGERLRSLL